jgi:hypothetical protein
MSKAQLRKHNSIECWPNVSSPPRCHLLAGAQFWLQGHPDKSRPRLAVRLGNLISDVRAALWRCFGWEWL